MKRNSRFAFLFFAFLSILIFNNCGGAGDGNTPQEGLESSEETAAEDQAILDVDPDAFFQRESDALLSLSAGAAPSCGSATDVAGTPFEKEICYLLQNGYWVLPAGQTLFQPNSSVSLQQSIDAVLRSLNLYQEASRFSGGLCPNNPVLSYALNKKILTNTSCPNPAGLRRIAGVVSDSDRGLQKSSSANLAYYNALVKRYDGPASLVSPSSPYGIARNFFKFSYEAEALPNWNAQMSPNSSTYGQTVSTRGQAAYILYQSLLNRDADSDGVRDGSDNCPQISNPSQTDFDGDRQGDSCDSDDDNDGILDLDDAFPFNAAENLDSDQDGTGNNADLDDDNDGVPDASDAFPLNASESKDNDMDGVGDNADADDDGDGVADAADNCPALANADQADNDHDGQGNACDETPDGSGNSPADFCPPYAQSSIYRPRTNRLLVSPSADWESAVRNAPSDTEILFADGTYRFSNNSWFPIRSNITLRSQSGNRDGVVFKGPGYAMNHDGFSITGQNVTIADLSITQTRNHAISIKGESIKNPNPALPDPSEAPHIYNVHLYNIGTQMIKGTPDTNMSDGVKDGLIACSRFEYKDDDGRTANQWKQGDYNGGIDLHNAVNFVIRDNHIENITGTGTGCEVDLCGAGYISHPGIFVWNQARGTLTERNVLLGNYRGIAYGLARSHTGGIIRNNFIYRPAMVYHEGGDVPGDAGIELETATGALVAHNTVYTPGYRGAIEARSGSNNRILNNFVSSEPWNRGDTNLTIQGNIGNLQVSDLASSSDPHLKANSRAMNACSALAEVSSDIDGESRAGRCDVGADFYSSGSGTAPADSDGDGITDGSDNCPQIHNTSQADADGDGTGDACDPTPNGDGGNSASSVVLQQGSNNYSGTADTFISERSWPPENVANFGGAAVLRTYSVNDRRILIRFDLSQFSADTPIQNADLALYTQVLDYPNTPTLDCYRITESWTEGSKVSEWDGVADGANWTSRGPGLGNWSQAGGSIAEKVCSGSYALNQWSSCDVKAVVQQWVSGSVPNYGLLCTSNVAYANDTSFSSSESATAANRPKLSITYGGSGGGTPPSGPFCGNGTLESGEACDDHNTANGDGCSSSCQIESAPPPPPPPPPSDTDGDGVADDSDNCPGAANANQADADHDGIGDACDSTPNGSGPGQSSGDLRATRLQSIQSQVSTLTNNTSLAQPTALAALHRSGQTFLTWTENASISGESYVVYRHTAPITSSNIASATPMAIVKENSSYYRSEATRSGSVQQRFIIQDGGPQLSSGTGLFVNTPADSGNFYYAVATTSGGQVNKGSFGPGNSLSAAVAEAVNDPKPVLVATGSNNGHISRIYTQFMDYHNWNPTMHGYAYNYSVTVESSYVPTGSALMPITVHIDGKNTRYTNAETYGSGIWISLDAPYFASYAEQDWYWGFSCYNNFQDATRTTVDDGPICNFSEIRMLRALKDTIRDPYYSNHADPTRIYAWGHSMGASGVISWAMHYPQIFSIVYASEGMTDYAGDPVWRNENQGRWGSLARNNPVLNLGISWIDGSNTAESVEELNGLGIWDYMDHKTLACDAAYADKETAFIIAVHGSNDDTIQAASQGYPFYQCMDNGKRGYVGQVNGAYHGWQGYQPGDAIDFRMLVIPWNPYEDAISMTPDADKSFPNQSYIAFSNTTGSDLATNSGLSDYNLNVMWDVSQVTDLPTRYEAVLYTSSTSSVSSDVTPRRLQSFQALPGHAYGWQNVASNGQVLASGSVVADSKGLITVPGFSISSAGNRLILTY